jgi:hypothetical protein
MPKLIKCHFTEVLLKKLHLYIFGNIYTSKLAFLIQNISAQKHSRVLKKTLKLVKINL